MGFTFDGPNKLIILTPATIAIEAGLMYSRWKDWVATSDNSKYLPAMSVLGGDPLPGGLFVGSTFFLESGWKIRPFEGNHSLNISGNLFSRDGSSIVVKTLGNYNVLVTTMVSSLTTAIATEGGTGTSIDYELVQAAVWNAPLATYMTDATFGKMLQDQGTNIMKVLGLVHQNIMIDQTEYDAQGNLISSRIRIWENAEDVGTANTPPLASYAIECTATAAGRFSSWKQLEI